MSVPSGGASGSLKLVPSDPRLVTQAGELSDWTIPEASLRYVVEGTAGPASWTESRSKASAAFTRLGLGVAYVADPLFAPATPGTPDASLGYGYLIGESDLKPYSGFRLLSSENYESFIATVQYWANPRLAKGTVDRAEVPHAWSVRVRAGRMLTSHVSGGRFGMQAYRMHWKPAPTDDGYGWVASTLKSMLQ